MDAPPRLLRQHLSPIPFICLLLLLGLAVSLWSCDAQAFSEIAHRFPKAFLKEYYKYFMRAI